MFGQLIVNIFASTVGEYKCAKGGLRPRLGIWRTTRINYPFHKRSFFVRRYIWPDMCVALQTFNEIRLDPGLCKNLMLVIIMSVLHYI